MKHSQVRRKALIKKAQKLYAVYDAITDKLLAFGTSGECANILGCKNISAFYETCSKVLNGKNRKYVIVVLDDMEDE